MADNRTKAGGPIATASPFGSRVPRLGESLTADAVRTALETVEPTAAEVRRCLASRRD